MDFHLINTCSCGQETTWQNCEIENHYSWWGLFLLGMGISAHPDRVSLKCPVCSKKIDELTEKEKIQQFLRERGHS